MPNITQFAQAIAFVFIVAHDIRTQTITNKAIESYEMKTRRHEAQIDYLCYLLNKYDVPADEFDLIALNQPIV